MTFTFLLVWPSHYSRLGLFRELIAETTFAPRVGMTVKCKMVEGYANQDIPIKTCSECSDKLAQSRILEAMKSVKWGLMDTGLYNAKDEVVGSCLILCMHLFRYACFMQDPRLYELATAIRGGIKHSFNNGEAKMVVATIVHVLRTYCLCPDHNLSLNV